MLRRPQDVPQDFGIGSAVARAARARYLNRDGTFNVRRMGLGFLESWSAYHWLLSLSWPRFLGLLACAFVTLNAGFAAAYVALGAGALSIPADDPLVSRVGQAFFFSVETFASIGYGHVSPRGLAANLVMSAEAFISVLGLALTTGLIFARFARPVARVKFSDVAVIAPYQGITGFMFRIANVRRSELLEVRPRVALSRRRENDPTGAREFHELPLERDTVVFFPLSWTIVHPIDEASPLYGISAEELRDCDTEFLVYLTAFDETFSQTVHARSSYKAEDIRFGEKFATIIDRQAADGIVRVDVRRLSETEAVAD